MAYQFILPDIGEGVVEAEVQRWFVKPGDEVHEDQPLVEVMTDKATVTIPSPRRGRVTRLHYREGEIARVHEPLLDLEVEEVAEAAPAAAAVGAAAPVGSAAPPPAPPRLARAAPLRVAGHGQGQKALATPAVRALARQLGIDLAAVPGTGPGGRVTKEDLDRARGDRLDGAAAAPAPQRPAPFAQHLPERHASADADDVLPLRGVRRAIAEHMARSKHTAAHFTFVEEVDVTELERVKDRIAAAAKADGVKVTFLPFIVKAAVAALKQHPWLNATLDEGRAEIRLRREYHVGIATATDYGLVVPVVRHADRLSLLEVAREIERLSADAKAGKAQPADLRGSTFTITSLGAQGGLFATPIINYPEVAILGVHRIRATPVVRDGQIVARDIMHVSLSFDHRVVDGHVGAAFAATVVGYLEDPNLLFMRMV